MYTPNQTNVTSLIRLVKSLPQSLTGAVVKREPNLHVSCLLLNDRVGHQDAASLQVCQIIIGSESQIFF
jgi:hypothetical protein